MKSTLTHTLEMVTELVLKPHVKTRLLSSLRTIEHLREHIKALEHSLDVETAVVENIRDIEGVKSFMVDGFTITRVVGTTETLDKLKLVSLGCAAAWLTEATVEKPKKAYTLVTLPGAQKASLKSDE